MEFERMDLIEQHLGSLCTLLYLLQTLDAVEIVKRDASWHDALSMLVGNIAVHLYNARGAFYGSPTEEC